MIASLALALFAACTAPAPAQPPPAPPAEAGADHPPADLKSHKLVRCLVDAPDGCSGCDRGDTCVYQQLEEYDCVYIVYGTKCD